jgi:spermidine/putrescine transport system substrate-binding protein
MKAKRLLVFKRVSALILAALFLLLIAVQAFAADNEELFADMDKDYYGRYQGQNVSINVYNWGEYISNGEDDSLNINAAFEELTGIHVNYTNYATNEELYAKLRAGGASYDVIIPSDYMIGRMAAEGMLLEINKDNIPNLKYLNPAMLGMSYDPDNAYSIPYMWGTVVLIYNTTMVSSDTDVETWDLLWNEKYKGQILMFNNPRDAYGIALMRAGLGPNPKTPTRSTWPPRNSKSRSRSCRRMSWTKSLTRWARAKLPSHRITPGTPLR